MELNNFELFWSQLKDIRIYLIKIGPSRRVGAILETKLSEANEIYNNYKSYLESLQKDLDTGIFKSEDVSLIRTSVDKIESLYIDIVNLCIRKVKVLSETNMTSFDLKTALNLLPVLTNEETVTKQLIDNIEYYDSILSKPECKQNLINFVLKSRLSQTAKLRLKSHYDTVKELVQDMRMELLPRKAATAIQSKLQKTRQNELSISDYGKELTELFVDLTISQASGDTKSYDILRPINEKFAIKQFADGLRNRRLSTIISARNYDSLKDAIQAAQDEEVSSAAVSGEILGMYKKPYYNTGYRGRGYPVRHFRSGFNNRSSTYRSRGNYGYQPRTSTRNFSYRGHREQSSRPSRGNFYNSRRGQGARKNNSVNVFGESSSNNNTQNDNVNMPQHEYSSSSNRFFLD